MYICAARRHTRLRHRYRQHPSTARTREGFREVVEVHNGSYKLSEINKGVYRREMSRWRRGLPSVLDGQVQDRRYRTLDVE